MNDSEVGAVMSKFLSGKFYRRNKKCLEDALIIIQKVYRVRIREIPDDKSEHKIILCAVKEHKTYIKRAAADWIKILRAGCFFVDIQGKIQADQLKSEGFRVWRL